MKESIANSYVFMIVIIFVGVIMLVFLSSLAYSKAFKVKNKIIDLIEKYDDGYEPNQKTLNEQIDEMLKNIGYRVNTRQHTCPERKTNSGKVLTALNTPENYRYCIYKETQGRGDQYYVIVYMYFDIPIVDSNLEFPLSGQTKVFYHTIDNHGKCYLDAECGGLKCINNKCQ